MVLIFTCYSKAEYIYTWTENLKSASKYLCSQTIFFTHCSHLCKSFLLNPSMMLHLLCFIMLSPKSLHTACDYFPSLHQLLPRFPSSWPHWWHWLHVVSKWGGHMLYSLSQLPAQYQCIFCKKESTSQNNLLFPLKNTLHKRLQFHLIVQHQLMQVSSFQKSWRRNKISMAIVCSLVCASKQDWLLLTEALKSSKVALGLISLYVHTPQRRLQRWSCVLFYEPSPRCTLYYWKVP